MAGAASRRTDQGGCGRAGRSGLAAPASGGQRVRAARADRLCNQSPAVAGGRMSGWGETFAALSGGSDTLDTIRHSGDPLSIVSHSVNSVTAAPMPSGPSIPPAVDRALAIWGEAEAERAVIVGDEGAIPRIGIPEIPEEPVLLRDGRSLGSVVPRVTVDWDISQADQFRTRGVPWKIKRTSLERGRARRSDRKSLA